MPRTIEQDAALWAKHNPGPTLRPRLWTKDELLVEFRKEADYPKLAATFSEKIAEALVDQLTPGASGTVTMVEKLIDLVKDKIKEKAVGKIISSVVQNQFESKAEGKMVRRFGTQFLLTSINLATHAAFPFAIPITALFTVIIYIGEKEKEQQEQWNKELAEILDARIEDIRARRQEKLDEKHVMGIERMLMSGAACEDWDDAKFGSYQYKDERKVVLCNADVARVLSCTRGSPCSKSDVMMVCATLRIKPQKNGPDELTKDQLSIVDSFIKEWYDANGDAQDPGKLARLPLGASERHTFPKVEVPAVDGSANPLKTFQPNNCRK